MKLRQGISMIMKGVYTVFIVGMLAACANLTDTGQDIHRQLIQVQQHHVQADSALDEQTPSEYEKMKTELTDLGPKLSMRQQLQVDNKQVTCLSYNIFYEARNQGPVGWTAVGWVTLNRKRDGRFGNDLCAAVYQKTKNNRTGKTHYEFSWVGEHHNMAPDLDEKYLAIRDIAAKIYYGEIEDNTRGSLFYHTLEIHPNWKNLIKTTVIGSHIFYRTRI
jgi:spore germination cell wall hydrolase CwlJ-like protein